MGLELLLGVSPTRLRYNYLLRVFAGCGTYRRGGMPKASEAEGGWEAGRLGRATA
ncbi:MAG: hypothetical protein ACPGLY_19790 [Rubripirellula sp.]